MNDLLTADELCKQLKISKGFLYKLRDEGLPHYQIGRCIRYNTEDVQLWLEKQKLEIKYEQ